ncbi:hypothetical protein UFOVP273_48 [uncultured Caudovirales phage]|uniref:Uncharacterized protein n=1 Tax=uncultured Caudovirales phage TaxID=2100421 RepID=A0A6J5LJK8_9CAUD|nr:hypothetical protein UFOVP273_48 [uncultured Caudovirales phage]
MSLVPIFVVLYVSFCLVTGWALAGPVFTEVKDMLAFRQPTNAVLDQSVFTRIVLMLVGIVMAPLFFPILFSPSAYDAAVDGLLKAFMSE